MGLGFGVWGLRFGQGLGLGCDAVGAEELA